MVNLGSSTSTKEHERISGNFVITTIDVSGMVITASSSGNWVNISGASVITSVSGNVVAANVSGNAVTVSGNWVYTSISGNTVVANVYISGIEVYATVSGDAVRISGETVTVIGSPTPLSVWSSGAGVVATTLSNTNTNYLSYVEYNATSGATTSSEFYITHTMAGYTGYPVKILSMNMATDTTTSVLFTPDIPMILLSGDQVSIVYSNPNSCSWNTRIVAGR